MSEGRLPGVPYAVARDELVELGSVTRPHGVRGEVRVFLYNPESRLPCDASNVFLMPERGPVRAVEVRSVRLGPKGMFLIAFEGVSDRAAADALRGISIAVHERELPPLTGEEWYHRDLIGLEVWGPAGETLGVVESVVPYPTIDCLRIRSGEGIREVPMAEPWLVAVDLERRVVRLGSVDDLPLEP